MFKWGAAKGAEGTSTAGADADAAPAPAAARISHADSANVNLEELAKVGRCRLSPC